MYGYPGSTDWLSALYSFYNSRASCVKSASGTIERLFKFKYREQNNLSEGNPLPANG